MTNREVLAEICRYEVDGKIYENYSGRGMMGKTCIGCSTYNYVAMIEAAASKGIRGARWDQLGKGYIVYWPNLNPDTEGSYEPLESELCGEADVMDGE